jgi:hypothetical protein
MGCQTGGRPFRAAEIVVDTDPIGLNQYSMGVSMNPCRIALQARSPQCYPSPAQRRRDARWEAF